MKINELRQHLQRQLDDAPLIGKYQVAQNHSTGFYGNKLQIGDKEIFVFVMDDLGFHTQRIYERELEQFAKEYELDGMIDYGGISHPQFKKWRNDENKSL